MAEILKSVESLLAAAREMWPDRYHYIEVELRGKTAVTQAEYVAACLRANDRMAAEKLDS